MQPLRKTRRRIPTFAEEKALYGRGYKLPAGIDEVGRGSLAGPVVAAAVILPQKIRGSWLKEVRDSKLLTANQRESLFEPIKWAATAFGVGQAPCGMVDSEGIIRATEFAMRQAVSQLSPGPDFLLVDFMKIREVDLPQRGIIDGDTYCMSIACASIIAKVTRDRMMAELDSVYPGYNFGEHKGYGTKVHRDALVKLGPCPIHRRSFGPVKEISGNE
jgi:ribonuclease HII